MTTLIDIPDEVTPMDDSILVRIAEDATGPMNVYVNWTKIKRKK